MAATASPPPTGRMAYSSSSRIIRFRDQRAAVRTLPPRDQRTQVGDGDVIAAGRVRIEGPILDAASQEGTVKVEDARESRATGDGRADATARRTPGSSSWIRTLTSSPLRRISGRGTGLDALGLRAR